MPHRRTSISSRRPSALRGLSLLDSLEARTLFSFVIHPTVNDVYAEALAHSGSLISQNANPATASDSSTYAHSTANGNYTASANQLVLHADASETSLNDSSATPAYAQSEALVRFTFTLTNPSTISIAGNLSLADAGGGNQPQGLGLNYAGGLPVFNDFADAPSPLPATINLDPGDYTVFADAVAYYNFASGTKSSTADLTLTITAEKPLGTPPAITSANAATFRIGVPSNFTVTTTGDPTPSISETAFLPDGITFVDNHNGTATLSGTPKLTDASGNYDLIFTASNGIPIDSTHPNANQFFTLTLTGAPVASSATHLVFSRQPLSTIAGHALAPITVLVEDKNNRVVTSDSSIVSLALSGTPGGALRGSASVHALHGVATFTTLSIIKAGTFALTASDAALPHVKSVNFSIAPDLASAHMILSTTNLPPVLIGHILPPLTAILEDRYGNIIRTNASAVTLQIVAGPAKAKITGPATTHFANGFATLKNLFLAPAGTYSLRLFDPSLPAAGQHSALISARINRPVAT